MSVSAEVFIKVMQNTPGFGVVERKGKAHVFTWNDRGYLVRAVCGARPPISEPKYLRPHGDNGMWVYKLGLDMPFDKEQRAAQDRRRLRDVIGLVTCDTCSEVVRRAVNEIWKARDLLQYLPPEERGDL
jgi:hypothetical protein